MKTAHGPRHAVGNYISESFKQRADSSAFFEAWVGAKLARSNIYTIHHPFTLAAETGNPLSFYANTWDLDVSPDGKLYRHVEVKSVNLKFTEPNDYPHMGVLVCSEASWLKKWPGETLTQRDFLMVSRLTGGIIWLPVGTETGRTEVTDNTRKEKYWCITTHKSELRPLASFVQHVHASGDPWRETS
jgi:hypothetical protein